MRKDKLRKLSFWLASALAVLVTLLPQKASAQYFGQNKVRYKTFDFKVLHTQHFDIYYYDAEAKVAPELGRMAERWYARFENLLGWQLSSRQVVIVYASSQDFRSTTVIPGEIGESTGGVTEALRRRIVMPLAGPMGETDHVLGHEIVHAFQYDITSRGEGPPGVTGLPLWFVEGMAEYLSLGPVDPLTALWMRDAVREQKLPKIKDLDNPKYFPYRWGQALWAYIGGRWGDKAVAQMLRVAGNGNLNGAFQAVLKITPDELSKEWQTALRDQYGPVIRASEPPTESAKMLVSEKQHGGTINVSPVLSPDGKTMAFFSSKDLFSVDLYLADAETGAIKEKLTSTATDAHVESLEFINSAGAWSLDGKMFAYPAIGGGHAELIIRDMRSGDKHTIELKSLEEVYNPTWSPDGRRLAFSANTNGYTDLFVIDADGKNLRRLTNDFFADLQPAWSPDGKQIAFVTDRFNSNLDGLAFGNYQLGLIDPESGRVELLKAFDTGKEINPQWSPDGRSIYFVSNHSGKPDIYRLDLVSHEITQVTNLQTGVLGITALSPTFSVAAKADRLVYSTFLANDYDVFAISSAQELAGSPPRDISQLDAGVLPPRDRATGVIASYLHSPQEGLIPNQTFRTNDYHPSLSLLYVAPPQVGIGFSSYGNEVAGGTALYFSDMLGFHQLVVNLQTSTLGDASNFLRNFAGTATYLNQHSRWTWGFTGGQIPYLTGGFGQGLVDLGNGQLALAEQQITFWQINRQIAGILAYPFSRAQRIEFQTGYENIAFAGQTELDVFDPITGALLGRQKQDIPSPSALNMAIYSAALVYDTSVFGGTSPVLGQSYRFEVGGNSGSLNFGTLLLDYRKYQKLGPFTLAGRAYHFGRYGGDSQDPRLQDLFLGYDSLVRGYDPNSFSVRECGPQVQVTGTCPAFDRLIGSRIAVGNAELRLPLLGPLGVIPGTRGVPPAEIAPFYDVGVAWDRGERPSFFGGNAATGRHPVSSYGASFRINLLGYAVGQVSLVHPNDRPTKSWMWQFSLLPGF